MKREELNYIILLLIHVGIGFLVYLIPFTAKLYGFLGLILGIYYIVKTKNRNHECLYAAAYLVGSELLLRMTNGNITYEFSKYGVMIFMLIGAIYSGMSKRSYIYWLFIVLLIPGVILSTFALDFDTDIKNAITFNISGPLCLAFTALYTYRRVFTLQQFNNLMLSLGLPIVSAMIYLIFYTPNIRDIITGTASTYATSGGFGPNQVATYLGLGMFIFFSRVILESKSKIIVVINLIIAFNFFYRGMVTFSRGGMITGLLMIVILLLSLYFKANGTGKIKLGLIIIIIGTVMLGAWSYTSFQTGGLINKRYANQDAAGREKENQFTGREMIALSEIDMFLDNPLFGVGVGKGVEIRKEKSGIFVLSHDEITRMMAEHGLLGIFGLLILIVTPMALYLEKGFNLYLLCLLSFWFLTINHAAMRTAVSAFVYGLALLNVKLIPNKPRNEEHN
ncbi:O-antigen ligase family protein [Flavobacterium algicola]|uniref:O-antigen ligase family protein n=1 Tax=Flavobacterium algicola TaxID=556529 RepID=UPI001EFDC550|nr:O-antigen ligase family protein [Flavobacterium algicola]MCG9793876.1 O-antigen ligase family protein [Flavobacterium algicola]